MSSPVQVERLVLDRTKKDVCADHKSKTLTFLNGDVKHILEDGKVVSAALTSVCLKLSNSRVEPLTKFT